MIVVGRVAVLEQPGDAEVEQLHLAGVSNQDVRRLEIPVHDQPGVRVRDGPRHLQEQLQPRAHGKALGVRIIVDTPAGHEFERQVRLPGARQACVVQPGDVAGD